MASERSGRVVLIDTSYPVVCLEIHGAVSDSEWQRYLRWFEDVIARAHAKHERIVLICDTTHATQAVTPLQRKQQAEMIAQNRYSDVMIGLAAVITNGIVRGAMTALLWIQPLPCEHSIVATRAEAERWARETIRKAVGDQAWSRRGAS
jgi:hypothetical protein